MKTSAAKLEKKRNALAVRVAKDLLKNLRFYGHIGEGDYCFPAFGESLTKFTPSEASKKCNVCAIGALFVEAMRINGKTFPDGEKKIAKVVRITFRCRRVICRALRPAFSGETLDAIEDAFEQGWHFDARTTWPWTNWRGDDGSRERLRDILKWIIKHDGEFPLRTKDD